MLRFSSRLLAFACSFVSFSHFSSQPGMYGERKPLGIHFFVTPISFLWNAAEALLISVSGGGRSSHLFPHSYVNFSQSALLKFHLGIGVDGVYSTSAGWVMMIGQCCDLIISISRVECKIWVSESVRDSRMKCL